MRADNAKVQKVGGLVPEDVSAGASLILLQYSRFLFTHHA
jgi:hypothetical protein